MTLPPQVPPRTPREPKVPGQRPTPPGRRERPAKTERRTAPPGELMHGRRAFMGVFRDLRSGWREETIGETEVEAFTALIAEMNRLAVGEISGQEVLDKLA